MKNQQKTLYYSPDLSEFVLDTSCTMCQASMERFDSNAIINFGTEEDAWD